MPRDGSPGIWPTSSQSERTGYDSSTTVGGDFDEPQPAPANTRIVPVAINNNPRANMAILVWIGNLSYRQTGLSFELSPRKFLCFGGKRQEYKKTSRARASRGYTVIGQRPAMNDRRLRISAAMPNAFIVAVIFLLGWINSPCRAQPS